MSVTIVALLRYAVTITLTCMLVVPAIAQTTTSSSVQSSSSSYSIPVFKYTLVKNGKGRPTPAPTKTLTQFVVTNTNGVPQATHFINGKGNLTQQFVVPDGNGSHVMFSTNNSMQIQAFHANGQRMIVDGSGVRIWNAKGNQQIRLPIPNLKSTLASMATAMPTSDYYTSSSSLGPISIGKRAPEPTPAPIDQIQARVAATAVQTVDFEIDYLDQCGSAITGHAAAATCSWNNPITGFSKEQEVRLVELGSSKAYYGYCSAPALTDEDKQACLDMTKNLLSYLANSFLSDSTNWKTDLAILGGLALLAGFGEIAATVAAAAAWFDRKALLYILNAFTLYQQFVTYHGVDAIAPLICNELESLSMTTYAALDIEGNGPAVDAQYNRPYTSFTVTRTVTISSKSCSSSSSSSKTSSASPPPSPSPSCAPDGNEVCPSANCVDKICGYDIYGITCLCQTDASKNTICVSGMDSCAQSHGCTINSDCAQYDPTFVCSLYSCETPVCMPRCDFNPNAAVSKWRKMDVRHFGGM